MQYLLQISGVNIYATVEDTNQLSVQRGSSLLLRQAIKNIEEKFPQLKSISTGASIGLFQFEAADLQAAKKIRDEIANDYLNKDTKNEGYRYLTFVVDVAAIQNNDFKRAKEEVIALNRFRQFQQATLVFPPENTKLIEKDKPIGPCAWDNLRPADGKGIEIVTREKKDHGPAVLSLSVEARHRYGRDQKRKFIKEETGLSFDYTNDLQEIAETDTPHLSSLNNKLAVLYFDGNGFGDIQKALNQNQLQEFDKTVQTKRKAWLRNLIETIQKDDDFKTGTKRKNEKKESAEVDAIRLEILLWGGDELMLAVPAWKGMEVLQHFYDFHKDWIHEETNNGEQITKHLTHAGGLVFCHVKTPIQRIKKLAREIADHIKDEYLGEGKIDKYKLDANLYDYVVLESIDYPTQSWGSFLTKRYTQAVAKNRQPQQPLKGYDETHRDKFNGLKEKLPRRQLYRLAHAIINPDEEFAKTHLRFTEVVDNTTELEDIAKQLFPNIDQSQVSNLHWLHLLELWDYFAPPDTPPEKEASKESTS
jgi:hypothetical protein